MLSGRETATKIVVETDMAIESAIESVIATKSESHENVIGRETETGASASATRKETAREVIVTGIVTDTAGMRRTATGRVEKTGMPSVVGSLPLP